MPARRVRKQTDRRFRKFAIGLRLDEVGAARQVTFDHCLHEIPIDERAVCGQTDHVVGRVAIQRRPESSEDVGFVTAHDRDADRAGTRLDRVIANARARRDQEADAVDLPVTVKHRIGIDRTESYEFVRDFVGEVARGGARVFIVHARNAWLKGLSPKENRELPPLRYGVVHRLKADFPDLTIVLNGGLISMAQCQAHVAVPDPQSVEALNGNPAGDALQHALDGVMLGREAYHNPWLLSEVDPVLFGAPAPCVDRAQVVDALASHACALVARGGRVRDLSRHVLGLFNGLPGARRWRRMLSDANLLAANDWRLLERAGAEVQAGAPVARATEQGRAA